MPPPEPIFEEAKTSKSKSKKKKATAKIIPIQPIPNENKDEEKMVAEPSLELKFYDSVSDFDYKIFSAVPLQPQPIIPTPTPKVSVSV